MILIKEKVKELKINLRYSRIGCAYVYVVHILPRNIKRLIQWAPIIWKDRDWDWEYSIRIFAYKLERLEGCIVKKDHALNKYKYADQILKCREDLNIFIDDEVAYPFDLDKPETLEELLASSKKNARLRRAAFKRALKNLESNLEHWWS